MSVRAKFYVQEVRNLHVPSPDQVCAIVKLAAVYGTGEDNKDWCKYTPQGSIEMTITNQSAIDYFDLGQEVYVTFDKAKKLEEREVVNFTANDLVVDNPETK